VAGASFAGGIFLICGGDTFKTAAGVGLLMTWGVLGTSFLLVFLAGVVREGFRGFVLAFICFPVIAKSMSKNDYMRKAKEEEEIWKNTCRKWKIQSIEIV